MTFSAVSTAVRRGPTTHRIDRGNMFRCVRGPPHNAMNSADQPRSSAGALRRALLASAVRRVMVTGVSRRAVGRGSRKRPAGAAGDLSAALSKSRRRGTRGTVGWALGEPPTGQSGNRRRGSRRVVPASAGQPTYATSVNSVRVSILCASDIVRHNSHGTRSRVPAAPGPAAPGLARRFWRGERRGAMRTARGYRPLPRRPALPIPAVPPLRRRGRRTAGRHAIYVKIASPGGRASCTAKSYSYFPAIC
jgi:hypothetical protein